MPLRFNMLLTDEDINPSEVRLLRHQTGKVLGRTPYSLWRDDVVAFERYQSTQDSAQRTRFKGRYWASFVAPSPAGTLFVGIYEVTLIGSVPKGTIDPFTGAPVGGSDDRTPYYDEYECHRLDHARGRPPCS